jgi:hypothetical protein
MTTTLFSDDIVNASEFRTKQKYWFNRASSNPVTITYGSRNFAIMEREKISNLYVRKYYLELVIRHCDEVLKGVDSSIFPWLSYLDDGEKKEFHNELIASVAKAVTADSWSTVDELIEDWKATAETKSNSAVMKALKAKVSKDDYVIIR